MNPIQNIVIGYDKKIDDKVGHFRLKTNPDFKFVFAKYEQSSYFLPGTSPYVLNPTLGDARPMISKIRGTGTDVFVEYEGQHIHCENVQRMSLMEYNKLDIEPSPLRHLYKMLACHDMCVILHGNKPDYVYWLENLKNNYRTLRLTEFFKEKIKQEFI